MSTTDAFQGIHSDGPFRVAPLHGRCQAEAGAGRGDGGLRSFRYRATTSENVAQAAGISQGYVMRLFETKLGLFVSVVDDCNERVRTAVAGAADHVPNDAPDAVRLILGEFAFTLSSHRHD
jgi:AcrR family transcriptional regulator